MDRSSAMSRCRCFKPATSSRTDSNSVARRHGAVSSSTSETESISSGSVVATSLAKLRRHRFMELFVVEADTGNLIAFKLIPQARRTVTPQESAGAAGAHRDDLRAGGELHR
eukprot:gene6914-biopygen4207